MYVCYIHMQALLCVHPTAVWMHSPLCAPCTLVQIHICVFYLSAHTLACVHPHSVYVTQCIFPIPMCTYPFYPILFCTKSLFECVSMCIHTKLLCLLIRNPLIWKSGGKPFVSVFLYQFLISFLVTFLNCHLVLPRILVACKHHSFIQFFCLLMQ